MKDYEKVQKLEKDLFYLKELTNNHVADLKGWDLRMDHEKAKFDSFVVTYNTVVEKKQILFKNLEERIKIIEEQLENATNQVTINAHPGKVQCQFCNVWYSEKGIESHEKSCGMNPEIIEEKPEKAIEKIEKIINGNGKKKEEDQLEETDLEKLLAAKEEIEKKLAELKEEGD